MFNRALTGVFLAGILFCGGCQDQPRPEPTPKPSLKPATKIKLLVNVLKGVTAHDKDDVTRPNQDSVKKDVRDAVKDANKLLGKCGVELELADADIVFDAPNPDTPGSENMDGSYSPDKAKEIDKKAQAELKKAHGGPTKGFKIYLVTEITHKQGSEQGVGYWFPQERSEAIEPGFSILEVSILKDGRLLAHELAHGLGGLPDKDEKGNLMNPTPKVSDPNELADDQCRKLREGATKRE